MKNLKFCGLLLLITFTVSFALPANGQTKKTRKKSTVAKKKVVRKTARPEMAVKLGTTDTTPSYSETPVRPVKISSDNYTPIGGDDNQGSPTPKREVKIGSKNVNPCGGGKGNSVKIVGSDDNLTTPTENNQQAGGVVNGKASSLPRPPYPAAAKAVRANGTVSVQVLIDEEGNVVSANATSGHPLLRAAAEQAARGAKFSPTLLCGEKVKVSGIITYNFVAQ
jgi:TonB family protein